MLIKGPSSEIIRYFFNMYSRLPIQKFRAIISVQFTEKIQNLGCMFRGSGYVISKYTEDLKIGMLGLT